VATAEFSKFAGILSAALSQHHLSGFEIAHYFFNFHFYNLQLPCKKKDHIFKANFIYIFYNHCGFVLFCF